MYFSNENNNVSNQNQNQPPKPSSRFADKNSKMQQEIEENFKKNMELIKEKYQVDINGTQKQWDKIYEEQKALLEKEMAEANTKGVDIYQKPPINEIPQPPNQSPKLFKLSEPTDEEKKLFQHAQKQMETQGVDKTASQIKQNINKQVHHRPQNFKQFVTEWAKLMLKWVKNPIYLTFFIGFPLTFYGYQRYQRPKNILECNVDLDYDKRCSECFKEFTYQINNLNSAMPQKVQRFNVTESGKTKDDESFQIKMTRKNESEFFDYNIDIQFVPKQNSQKCNVKATSSVKQLFPELENNNYCNLFMIYSQTAYSSGIIHKGFATQLSPEEQKKVREQCFIKNIGEDLF